MARDVVSKLISMMIHIFEEEIYYDVCKIGLHQQDLLNIAKMKTRLYVLSVTVYLLLSQQQLTQGTLVCLKLDAKGLQVFSA